MSTTDLQKASADVPILAYAMEQRRWDRGILWLAGLVCVAQFLMAPAGVWESYILFTRRINLWQENGAVLVGLFRSTVPLAIAICTGMLLLNLRVARVWLIVCTCVMISLWVIETVLLLAHGRWPGGSIYGRQIFLSQKILRFVVWCYPVVLLVTVQKRRDEGRQWSAAVIWWLTAIAALIVAAPTVWGWLTHGERSWYLTITQAFGPALGTGEWRESFMAFGTIIGGFASFSAVAAIIWTLIRGISGRWAL